MQELPAAKLGDAIPQRSPTKERAQTIIAGITLTLLLLALAITNPAAVERLNNAVSDIQIGLLPKTTLSPLPVIVEVDELSLATYGQWPWPRYQVARLLTAIKQSGAAAVGIDAVFVEKDRTSPVEIQRMIEQDLQQRLPLTTIKESLWDYDTILGQTLKTGPFVLSYFFTFDNVNANPCQPKSAGSAWLSANGEKNPTHLNHAVNVTCNIPPIQGGANTSGFINTAPDGDGIYRKTPLVIEYKGRFYPSLALQAFLTANSLDHFLLSESETGLTLQLGKNAVPLDKGGNFLIKFPAHGQSFKKISAYDLLSGKLAANSLQGKTIFVGVSATGLHEFRPTPYNPQLLGVEFHAAIVDNLARQDFLHRPDNALLLELATASALAFALFAGLANAGLTASIVIPCLLIVALFVSSQLLLAETGIVISPALPIMMTLLVFLILALMKYTREYIRAKEMALQVARTQEGIIGSFCSMSEYRDPETGAHILRTQEYIKALAKHLQHHPKFKGILTNEVIELLFKAAPLHDIGKIGIRDHILLKNDRLTEIEFEIMQSHPQIGADIIKSVATQIGWNPFMQIAHQISLYHQEKWDGSGYPQGLAGEAIPFPARFMALADVYDALISKRVYKPAFSHDKAVSIIREGKDKHFDPLIVEAFETIHEQFRDIALRFSDNDEQREALLAHEGQSTENKNQKD
ncbi:MAG: CHASE2 domain-containing protein [Methyloglobulus sp.]|nr:CHASE2 domain-containing protein [Methyloglobulus sp.]